ncbi:MAG TPA: hypothetical protein VFC63_09320 [Blastocatellia bacterium]|nr:hypothetical protein [Blastocatellia bacterium]
MKTSIVIWLAFTAFAIPLVVQPSPRFEDYKVAVYSGPIHPPKWINHVGSDEWRDYRGKLVEPPEVNFAGKYYVAAHSCGTECRSYTLTDLSDGRELDLLTDFDAGDHQPKTRDGYTYITVLVTRANSRLLVAQYHVKLPGVEECRERAFVLDAGKIRPITKTRRSCARN